MEFWGVEVKAGQSLKVEPEIGKLIHISQAALGVVKDVKAAKYVPLRMKIDSKDFIIGSLAAEDRPQMMFDLVFEKEFELSHDWKNGSVFFVGYIADDPDSDGGEEFSDMSGDESEDELVHNHENGKCDHKADVAAPAAAAGPKKAARAVAENEETSDSEDDDEIDSDDSDEDMALAGEEDGLSGEAIDSDEDDDDDSDDSEEEELPKTKQSKKRPAEAAKQTPVPAKKAKSATPDTGNKKSHTATPFPSKAAGKTAAGNKSNEKTPKSAGQATCKPCSKTFNSESALLSHSKAKHGGK